MAMILIVGTLDTKGTEVAFVKAAIERLGHLAMVMDAGVLKDPPFVPDITRDQVAAAVGANVLELAERGDRGEAVGVMTRGAEAMAGKLRVGGRIDAVAGLGGSAGTTIATAVMRAFPLGVPKLMVSTLASGDVRPFVGVSDIVMMPAIVDVSGINRISRQVFTRAAAAICAMVDAEPEPGQDRPLVCASMFGNTTQCVERARSVLEGASYEVLVFHATGVGGQTMESLIDAGYISGVLDVTTTEWADELVGGVLSAGPTRLEAAARKGIPAVVAPGCLDMVNFWAPDTVPESFRGRLFYPHNPNVTLMRTTPEECAELGRIFAGKLNQSTGPVEVYLPLRGVSVISAPGQPFHSPEADQALFDAIRGGLRADINVQEVDANINDQEFADRAAEGLLRLLRN
ncbi:MAG: UPF0261 family protein [bacterium]|nr:UPF0261 family protein [bacterium]